MNAPATFDLHPLAALAGRVRSRILRLAAVRRSHIGSALSIADILAALYGDWLHVGPDLIEAPERDRFILSKGHGALALYAILAETGILGAEVLEGFGQPGNPLGGHPSKRIAGVEFATGALGHGLALGAGVALEARLSRRRSRAVVLMGDGELNEGSVWEAALFAAHQRLGRLVAIIDRNGLQQEGATETLLALEPLADKWRAFGWRVVVLDGHDLTALQAALRLIDDATAPPTVLIAATQKGKGVSFMEGQLSWHMAHLQEPLLSRALAEVDA
jgi:transketolase